MEVGQHLNYPLTIGVSRGLSSGIAEQAAVFNDVCNAWWHHFNPLSVATLDHFQNVRRLNIEMMVCDAFELDDAISINEIPEQMLE